MNTGAQNRRTKKRRDGLPGNAEKRTLLTPLTIIILATQLLDRPDVTHTHFFPLQTVEGSGNIDSGACGEAR
jgi:hypothetical protein